MKLSTLSTVLFLLAVPVTHVWADEQLLRRNNCLACHNANQTLVGPSWQQVAKRYQGQANAVDQLSKKIRAGGSGNWGQMPMPPFSQVSEADAKKLAAFVLATK